MPILLNKLLTEHACIPLETVDVVCSDLEQNGYKSQEFIENIVSQILKLEVGSALYCIYTITCVVRVQDCWVLSFNVSLDQCVCRSSQLTRIYVTSEATN